ncbi:insulinase family protein, partial [candidate division KSB1 bacterium]|nr:insulinase family protein [candidate division KSB1 bacterium]
MRRLIFVLFLFGLLMTACNPKTIQTEILNADDPTISVRLLFRTGSQDDPAGKEGLATLTANMLANASTKYNNYEQILKKLYPMASDYSAFIDKEMTVISGRVHKDKWAEYSELFKQAVLEPAFDVKDFERIRSDMLNYLENILRYSNDEELGKQALYQFIFEGTPYAHPESGLIGSVKKLTLDDVKEFYRNHYTQDMLTVGMGGALDGGLVKEFQKTFSALPQSGIPVPPAPVPEPIQGLQVLLIEKDTESTAISFGFPIDLLRSDGDFYAVWLANSWFGEHRSTASHLYQVIREARGMNYGDYSYIEAFPQGHARRFPPPNVARRQQIFQIWIRPVQNQARHFVLRAAVRELQKLVDNGLQQDEFELTQNFLCKYYLHFAPTTSARLGYQLDDRFYGIGGFLKLFPEKVKNLTIEEVND